MFRVGSHLILLLQSTKPSCLQDAKFIHNMINFANTAMQKKCNDRSEDVWHHQFILKCRNNLQIQNTKIRTWSFIMSALRYVNPIWEIKEIFIQTKSVCVWMLWIILFVLNRPENAGRKLGYGRTVISGSPLIFQNFIYI